MRRTLRHYLRVICGAVAGNRGRNLGRREAREVFDLVLEGEGTPAQIAALCVAVRTRGATADELAGFAESARARIKFPEIPEETAVISTSRMERIWRRRSSRSMS